MKFNNKAFEAADLRILEPYGRPDHDSSSFEETAERISRLLRGEYFWKGREDILQMTGGWEKKKGCFLRLRFWSPMSCQGRCWPEMELRYLARSPEMITWTRQPPSGLSEKHHQPPTGLSKTLERSRSIATGFDVLFTIFVEAYRKALELQHRPDSPGMITWTRKTSAPGARSPTTMSSAVDALCTVLLDSHVGALEIGSLGHAWAYQILFWKLANDQSLPALEFKSSGGLNLCCKLLRRSTALEAIRFDGLPLPGRSQPEIDRFFQSIRGNSNLQKLEMPTSRYLRSWEKGSTPSHSNLDAAAAISIQHLALAMEGNHSSIRELDLGGNYLSAESVQLLTEKLQQLDHLESLSLRGTGLDESTLIAVLKGVQTNNSIKELDLSHNTFSLAVMQELCLGLTNNTTLQRLIAEHCRIDLAQIKLLATVLPKMRALQHLELDGNEFTWEPLGPIIPSEKIETDFDPINNREHFDMSEPESAPLLAAGLEKNKSLLSLSMGQFGHTPHLSFAMLCCTSPPYTDLVGDATKARMTKIFKRNEKGLEKMKMARMEQAVVGIASLLLSKKKMEDRQGS